VFCLLVVLVKLSLLAKWLARKTPLRKSNHGKGIVSIKPRPNRAYDCVGLLYSFVVLLHDICVLLTQIAHWFTYSVILRSHTMRQLEKLFDKLSHVVFTLCDGLTNCLSALRVCSSVARSSHVQSHVSNMFDPCDRMWDSWTDSLSNRRIVWSLRATVVVCKCAGPPTG